MTTIDAASRQWASRPDDERFLTLDDLAASVGARRGLSRASDLRLDSLVLNHDTDGNLLLTSPDGQPVAFTNWSFGERTRTLRLRCLVVCLPSSTYRWTRGPRRKRRSVPASCVSKPRVQTLRSGA